jgi:hypothetical protein
MYRVASSSWSLLHHTSLPVYVWRLNRLVLKTSFELLAGMPHWRQLIYLGQMLWVELCTSFLPRTFVLSNANNPLFVCRILQIMILIVWPLCIHNWKSHQTDGRTDSDAVSTHEPFLMLVVSMFQTLGWAVDAYCFRNVTYIENKARLGLHSLSLYTRVSVHMSGTHIVHKWHPVL